MKAVIDKERLTTLQPPPSSQPPALPDPSLAQLISSQILALQKNMESNFGKMVDKIVQIEGRMQDATEQLE